MGKLYYLCNYDDYLNHRNLLTQPSGVAKINYIKGALKDAGIKFKLVSIAECRCDKWCLNLPLKKHIDDFEDDYYIFSVGRPNVLLKFFSRLLLYLQVIYFLLFKVNSEDKVLIYHSLNIAYLVYVMRYMLKRKVYFEVEEIYSAVYGLPVKQIQREITRLREADGYILVNDIMESKCRFKGNIVVCYGAYYVSLHSIQKPNLDGKIHVVYAGLIGDEKSDVYFAIDVAKYLPCNYHIHILGYGTEDALLKMMNYIQSNNDGKTSYVTYDGCLYGGDYEDFLNKCHIGLCTRVLNDELSDYTFPSKVLVYLGHGLIPICTPLNCVRLSRIKDCVHFSHEVSPQAIAKVVLSVKIEEMNRMKVIQDLHNGFVKEVREMFS